MSEPDAPEADYSNDLIAEPDPGYRWKHLIMTVLLVAGGLWFAYDGWVKWPNENAKIAEIQRASDDAKRVGNSAEIERLASELSSKKFHTTWDIGLQKVLACALPAFGLFWGGWTLMETRGMYRMAGNTLHVPGHPPITYDDIRRIDKRK